MAKRGEKEKKLPSEEEKQNEEPVTLKAGPLSYSGRLGPFGLLLLGLVAGFALAVTAINSNDQLSSLLVGPTVRRAVSATETARPAARPSLMVRVLDLMSGNQRYPERGEYKLNPGEKVKFKIESAGAVEYRWWLDPEDFGKFEESNPTEAEVLFTAPKDNNRRGTVKICVPDPNASFECSPGSLFDILIRTWATSR